MKVRDNSGLQLVLLAILCPPLFLFFLVLSLADDRRVQREWEESQALRNNNQN